MSGSAVESAMVEVVKSLYKNNLRMHSRLNWVWDKSGIKIELYVLDEVTKVRKKKHKSLTVDNWQIKNVTLQELLFVDDMVFNHRRVSKNRQGNKWENWQR